MASTNDIVIPLITGLGGGIAGATFTRVTSRNDVRRERYAAALVDARALADEARAGASSEKTQQAVYAHRGWLMIDSKPVGEAYEALVASATGGQDFAVAEKRYIRAARVYTRWTLHQRVLLHLRLM